MARTPVTPVAVLGPYPTLPVAANSLDFAFTAPAVAADGVSFVMTGREILLVQNTDVGAQTFTLESTVDAKGRTGDVTTYSLAAGEFACFDARGLEGWRQASGGAFYLKMSADTVKVAILRLAS